MAAANIPTDNELAATVRALIIADFSIYDSVPILAEKASISISTLQRVFKNAYGQSVSAFSRMARMEEAKRLLITTPYTQETIGEMVGYSEGSNFQQAFKVVVGMTPGKWRRMQGGKNNI